MSRMVGGSEFYFQNINIATGKEWASLTAQQVKNLPAVQETQKTQVQSLGQKDPLEREMVTQSTVSCLKNPMDIGAWQATVQRVTKSWA